jgi:hypothetical protein
MTIHLPAAATRARGAAYAEGRDMALSEATVRARGWPAAARPDMT